MKEEPFSHRGISNTQIHNQILPQKLCSVSYQFQATFLRSFMKNIIVLQWKICFVL